MTLTTTTSTISTTTPKNTKGVENTPVITMKGTHEILHYKIKKMTVVYMKRRMKASYAKRMRSIQSLMMVSNNDMRINLSRFTQKRQD